MGSRYIKGSHGSSNQSKFPCVSEFFEYFYYFIGKMYENSEKHGNSLVFQLP